MQTVHDPSTSSYYVNEQLYQELVTSFTDWQRDELAIHNLAERDQFRMLVEKEARLLDQLAFDEWLAMYAPECIYWVPGTPAAGDPRREISISFDDRRRMEDRIYRLRTGYAWSQAPKSRTVRMISNVETFATDQSTRPHGALEFPDQRVSRGRNAISVGLVRASSGAHGTPLGNPRPAGQPDRLRPEPAQSQHRALTRRRMSRPGRRISPRPFPAGIRGSSDRTTTWSELRMANNSFATRNSPI